MAITGAEQIKFVNEYIRPMCENIRYMGARGNDFVNKWSQLVSSFPNDELEIVEDGRESQGVSRLTGADIHAVAGVFTTLLGEISGATAQAVITKPCVRPLLYSGNGNTE